MKGKIRVAVVVDLPLLREGIVHALSSAENMIVVAGTQPGLEGLRHSRLAVDVLIVEMATTAGSFEFIERVSAQQPGVSILLLGAAGDPRAVISALKGGARGYVLKSVSGSDLVEAVRQLALGESYVSPNLAAQLLGATVPYVIPPDGPAQDVFATLTPRENGILPLLTKGYSNKEIARALGISEKTIKYHLTHLLRKLGVRNRVEAALIASTHLFGDRGVELSSH